MKTIKHDLTVAPIRETDRIVIETKDDRHVFKVLSVSVFVLMAVGIKATAHEVPPGQSVFFRSFFAIPVILVWLVWQGRLARGLRTANPMGHLWRGLVGTTAMGLGFVALGLLPLPEATALGYAAPLLTVIFGAMFLGEEVRLFRLSAVAAGLVGVMIVLSPRFQISGVAEASKLETVGAMAALLGAVFAALAQVFVRKLVTAEATATTSATLATPWPIIRWG